MSRARLRGSAAAAAAGVLFAIAWSLGLWLIVLGLCSASAVLVRQRVLARRSLPARLAAWAAHAPCGPSTPVALEHALAVDLAAISQGHLRSLERAQLVLAGRVDDPWRRALGEERLARAHRLVAGCALVGIEPRREPAAALLHIAGTVAALTALLVVVTLSQSRWWLVPMAVVHALLSVELVALYERRRALPELLAARSVRDPVQGLFVMPEEDVTRSLVTLANNDRVVIQRARYLLEGTDQHPHARQRLAEAEHLLMHGGGSEPAFDPSTDKK